MTTATIIDFKTVKISDKNIIKPYLLAGSHPICNFSFANLIIWQEAFVPKYAIVDNQLILQGCFDVPYYNFPMGEGNKKAAIEKIMNHCKATNQPFRFANLSKEMTVELEQWFPHLFKFESSRATADYVYLTERLTSLSGKKLQSKRNHIHQFEKTFDYLYRPLTKDDVPSCLECHRQWAKENNCGTEENCTHKQDGCAVEKALNNFEELDMMGAFLEVNNKVVAFTLGNAINENTFDVNIEKALDDYPGAYPTINKLFVLNQLQDYTYINREEDLGIEGLRKAKLSYDPYRLLEKYEAQTI